MKLILDIGNKYPEITGSFSDAFASDLRDVCAHGDFTELVLDLVGTRAISSMAMGTLFAVSQKLRDQGKSLRVVNASKKIVNLLRMVNMADLL